MSKLKEVEQARAIMNEAIDWSVLRWLSEKKKVRRAADAANAALKAEHERSIVQWPAILRRAYDAIAAKEQTNGLSEEIVRLAKQLHSADVKANDAHEQAEATFAKAEKERSSYVARQGCAEALESWDLLEKANAKAAAAAAKNSD